MYKMNLNLKSIFFVLILIGLSSCKETVTDIELPYKEQLVLNIMLEPGKPVKNIIVYRTLHPLEEFDATKALVTDAELSISDGSMNYPLTFSNGTYSNSDIIIETGKQYNLTALYRGKTATASTIVPSVVEYDSLQHEIYEYTYYDDYYQETRTEKDLIVFTNITPKEGFVYGGTNFYANQPSNIFFENIYQFKQRNSNGKIKVQLMNFPLFNNENEIQINNIIKNSAFVVIAFDEQYLNYYNTRYNGNSHEDIFGSQGLNVQWNIKGEGIGLFIGRNITGITK